MNKTNSKKEINNVDAIFSSVEDELKDRNNRIYKVAETPYDYVLCDDNNLNSYETDEARRYFNVKEGEYWYGTDIFLLELNRTDFEGINNFELLDEDGLEQTLINMSNRKYMILIKNILGKKGIDMLLKDFLTRFSFETVDENYKADGHFGHKLYVDGTRVCTQVEIKFRFWIEDGKIMNEPVWEPAHYIEKTNEKKNKKCFKPFTPVDFKDGFKAQLAKYNYPILKRISDELWYELLNIEKKYCGDCKYIKILLKEIRNTYMLSPIKQAEYLITLKHKAIIYTNIEPELSKLYGKESNEIFYKLLGIYEKFDYDSTKRQFEVFHSILNIDVPDYRNLKLKNYEHEYVR